MKVMFSKAVYAEMEKAFGKKDLSKLRKEIITDKNGNILSQQKDNIALVERLVDDEDKLFDSKEDLQPVEGFFKTQVSVFDAAVKLGSDMKDDLSYLQKDEEANNALNQIRLITVVSGGDSRVYKRIPELNGLMDKVRAGHNTLLEAKRDELLEIVRQCLEEIRSAAVGEGDFKNVLSSTDHYYSQMKEKIQTTKKLVVLDGFKVQLWSYKDETLERITAIKKPKPVTPPAHQGGLHEPPAPKKNIKDVYRQQFPAKILETPEDVEAYVERLKTYLTSLLKDCDGIKLK